MKTIFYALLSFLLQKIALDMYGRYSDRKLKQYEAESQLIMERYLAAEDARLSSVYPRYEDWRRRGHE